jgi:hypothetical protein
MTPFALHRCWLTATSELWSINDWKLVQENS